MKRADLLSEFDDINIEMSLNKNGQFLFFVKNGNHPLIELNSSNIEDTPEEGLTPIAEIGNKSEAELDELIKKLDNHFDSKILAYNQTKMALIEALVDSSAVLISNNANIKKTKESYLEKITARKKHIASTKTINELAKCIEIDCNGGKHIEVKKLSKTKAAALGAVLQVTLEPNDGYEIKTYSTLYYQMLGIVNTRTKRGYVKVLYNEVLIYETFGTYIRDRNWAVSPAEKTEATKKFFESIRDGGLRMLNSNNAEFLTCWYAKIMPYRDFVYEADDISEKGLNHIYDCFFTSAKNFNDLMLETFKVKLNKFIGMTTEMNDSSLKQFEDWLEIISQEITRKKTHADLLRSL